ncbi:uncharacterized protein L969DRAFT_96010 [Mixia osmundae IAM 14324]|uniref:Protein kinase domain-containing protein n=1 Tax=Mixia osmundae (strain CBS 9802 / IAM 14324 / JCM 22182 / KY 12970) TaxID=764103 RepID=G7DWR4_MIXOS|nr:uncharacterized protein L969DRAFT_97555 [Mixia osmundae IAM 14324]XP_014566736.1 uncharacterized protein L969DRAFT_96010 [Mixia osmundae IAM 14324]KEI36211.1 hypothetical protein L969DRAFT_97555 [Mixia osmundae IAM 14324]KEI38179.1 hypothetical protein L969DRAFT_96010 [Mixia osmundae IAM 14324]GAA95011.1 hypothetical protein E5Q_01666 [Mixia osmundae IAM 14324]
MSDDEDEDRQTLLSPPPAKALDKPLKRSQWVIMVIIMLCEPVCFSVIFPFINAEIASLGVPTERVGYSAGAVESAFALAQLFTVLAWGRASDKFGRKPIMISGLAGVAISICSFGLSRTIPGLIVSRSLAGGLSGNVAVAKSMMSEMTSPGSKRRTRMFSLMPVCWSFGCVIGSALGGGLSNAAKRYPTVFGDSAFLHAYPYALPCLIAAVFPFVGAVLSSIVLEETHPNHQPKYERIASYSKTLRHERTISVASAYSDDALLSPTAERRSSQYEDHALQGQDELEREAALHDKPKPSQLRMLLRDPQVQITLANFATRATVITAWTAILPLFAFTPVKSGGLGMSEGELGTMLSIRGLSVTFCQLFLFVPLHERYGGLKLYRFCMLLYPTTYIFPPFINQFARMEGTPARIAEYSVLFIHLAIVSFANISFSCISLLVNALASGSDSLGTLHGLSQTTVSFARAIAPWAGTSLFAWSITDAPEVFNGYLIWLLMILLGLVCASLSFGLSKDTRSFTSEEHPGSERRPTTLRTPTRAGAFELEVHSFDALRLPSSAHQLGTALRQSSIDTSYQASSQGQDSTLTAGSAEQTGRFTAVLLSRCCCCGGSTRSEKEASCALNSDLAVDSHRAKSTTSSRRPHSSTLVGDQTSLSLALADSSGKKDFGEQERIELPLFGVLAPRPTRQPPQPRRQRVSPPSAGSQQTPGSRDSYRRIFSRHYGRLSRAVESTSSAASREHDCSAPSVPEQPDNSDMASMGPINGLRVGVEDATKHIKVSASDGKSGAPKELVYTNCKVVGNGSFGVVFQAKLVSCTPGEGEASSPVGENGEQKQGSGIAAGEDVAIKKVLQDKRFKNRELQIMRLVSHPNVVDLRAFFYSNGEKKKDEVYLNLVLEFVPETVYRASRHFAKLKQTMPMATIKLYMYQLLRSLAYIHSLGICHRDIKPQNLLLNPITGVLKLCDFGSAKILIAGEPNVSYICSRYYRAPELIFGATNYTTNIDVWSTGCVMAELMLGQPLFPGESGIDQLVEIIKVLGTPSRDQIKTMNPNYMEHKFPQIKPHPFSKVFRPRTPQDAIDLISRLLEYTPSSRLTAVEAMCHPFFNELREADAKMVNGKDMPPLFDFTLNELSVRPDLNAQLVPGHAEEALKSRGIDVHNFQPLSAESMRITLD